MISKIRNFIYGTALVAGVFAGMLVVAALLGGLFGYPFRAPLGTVLVVALAVLVIGTVLGIALDRIEGMWDARHPVKTVQSDTEHESFMLDGQEYTFLLPVGASS